MKAALTLAALALISFSACAGEDGMPAGPLGDAGPNGCPSFRDIPIAEPGDAIGGHDFATFAGPFFQSNCTRCHASTRMGDARHGAPEDVNLDLEESVRANLVRIRNVIGESNIMPFDEPGLITCEQRRLIVEWIDVGAP